MKILVTGGGGFLGQALCRGLVARGHEVVSFQRGDYPVLHTLGVGQIRGDLADPQAVRHALARIDAVFHNAAKAGAWGSYDSYHQANVVGTQNVLDACRANGVPRLIYTSTPSVTHRATNPVEGLGADDVPYGEDLRAPYAATKAIAERAVLAANDAQLATVALRPRLIWGPGDNHLLPRLAARARAGRLRMVGDGSNLVDSTYIDNAAQAHFDAFAHLAPGAACAGKGVLHLQRRTVADARATQPFAGGGGCAGGDALAVVQDGVPHRCGVRNIVATVASARRSAADAVSGRAAMHAALVQHGTGAA